MSPKEGTHTTALRFRKPDEIPSDSHLLGDLGGAVALKWVHAYGMINGHHGGVFLHPIGYYMLLLW